MAIDEATSGKQNIWSKAPIVGVLVGVGGLGWWSTLYREDIVRALFAYHFAYIAVLSVALGALGFVLLRTVAWDLIPAIKTVLKGYTYVSPAVHWS